MVHQKAVYPPTRTSGGPRVLVFMFLINACYQGSTQAVPAEVTYVASQDARLARQPSSTVEVQVNLARWFSIGELRTLLQADGAPRVTILHARSSVDQKTLQTSIPMTTPEISDQVLKGHFETLLAESRLASVSEQARMILDVGPNEGLRIISFQGTGNAADILRWREANMASVRFVQTIARPFDRAQRTFTPEEIVR